ncbi:MAG: hypothetical protein V4699_02560 [Patescibacteria group bacterium]
MNTTHETKKEENSAQPAPGWTWMILGTILLLLAIAGGVRGCSKKAEADKEARKQTATASAPATHTVPAEKPWTFRTLTVPANGLAVKLYKGFKEWPKGGPVSITLPSGEVVSDQPGVEVKFDEQDGIYIFMADPKGSERKVEILNRWE